MGEGGEKEVDHSYLFFIILGEKTIFYKAVETGLQSIEMISAHHSQSFL